MRRISTLVVRAPKVSGKACVQRVAGLWAGCVEYFGVIRSPQNAKGELWITARLYPVLYTKCMQVFTALVGNFTSVNFGFYTVYTGPTKTTTTYINNYLGEQA